MNIFLSDFTEYHNFIIIHASIDFWILNKNNRICKDNKICKIRHEKLKINILLFVFKTKKFVVKNVLCVWFTKYNYL